MRFFAEGGYVFDRDQEWPNRRVIGRGYDDATAERIAAALNLVAQLEDAIAWIRTGRRP